jgi:hypothetical protein
MYAHTEDSLSRSSVGVATHEVAVVRSVLRALPGLIRPGRGRRLIVLEEVELGLGRPDVMAIVAHPFSLAHRANLGLRLRSLTEAQVLAATILDSEVGVSPSHRANIKRALRDRGWMAPAGRRLALKTSVSSAMIVEAKVSDWKCGLVQLARTRDFCTHSVLALPDHRLRLVPGRMMDRQGFGLLANDEGGSVLWSLQPRTRSLTLDASLWLTELAIRGVHHGDGRSSSDTLG